MMSGVLNSAGIIASICHVPLCFNICQLSECWKKARHLESITTPTIEPLNIQSEQFIYLNYFMILILMLFWHKFLVSVCYCIVSAACYRGGRYFITITKLLEHSTLPRHYTHISFSPSCQPHRNYRFTFLLLPRVISPDIYLSQMREFSQTKLPPCQDPFLFHEGTLKVSKLSIFMAWNYVTLCFLFTAKVFSTGVDLQLLAWQRLQLSATSVLCLAWNMASNDARVCGTQQLW